MYSAWEGGARTPWLLQLALAPLCRYRHLWLARSSTLTSVARACPSTLASTTRASPSILPSASAADTCPSTLTSVRVLTRMLHCIPHGWEHRWIHSLVCCFEGTRSSHILRQHSPPRKTLFHVYELDACKSGIDQYRSPPSLESNTCCIRNMFLSQ